MPAGPSVQHTAPTALVAGRGGGRSGHQEEDVDVVARQAGTTPTDGAGSGPAGAHRPVDATGLERLADLAARLVGAPSAQVVLVHDDVHEVVAAVGLPPGVEQHRFEVPEDTLCHLAASEERALVVRDAARDPRSARFPQAERGELGSYLGVPLREGERTVGVLCVYGPEPRDWSDHDVVSLQQLGASALAELDLARVADEVERTRLRIGLAIDAAGVGGWDWDLATGELDWDDRLLDIFGVEREDFGRSIDAFSSYLHPDDVDRVGAALQRAIDTGGTYEAEFRVLRPDGHERWVQGRGRALCDAEGRTTRMIGAAFDTTDVRDGDARVARVLESMSAAFYALDRDFRFTYVNAEAERLLGRPRDELLGGSVWELFPATAGSTFEEHYRAAVATGEQVAFEAHYPPPLDGWYEVRAWPVPDGLSVYFLEISQRRQAQAQVLAAAARLELLSRTTHQLTEVLDARTAVARLAATVVPDLADWSVVTLVEPDGGLRDVGWAHRDPERTRLVEQYAARRFVDLAPSAPVLEALRTGEPAGLARDAAALLDRTLGDAEARRLAAELAPEALEVLPLRAHGRTLGMLTLFWGPERGAPTPEDLATAREIAARAGSALDNARLYEEQRDLAAALQRSLLTEPPEPDHAELVVRYQPAAAAAQVGGDWYDSFLQEDGATVLVIGDVVGHDTAAAAAMGQVRGLLRGIAFTTGAGPAEVLSRLDAALSGLLVTTTATAVVLRLEQTAAERAAGTTRLRWSSAGHPPPMVLHADGRVDLLEVDAPDLLLGYDPASRRQEAVVVVERGATVLLYTDGLVEQRAQSLDTGLGRLRALLSELGSRPLPELCDALLERLVPSRPEDDVALVAVRLHPQDRPRPAGAAPALVPPRVPPEPAETA